MIEMKKPRMISLRRTGRRDQNSAHCRTASAMDSLIFSAPVLYQTMPAMAML